MPLPSYFPGREGSRNIAPVTVQTNSSLGNNPLPAPILRAPAESFASKTDGGSPDALVDAAERGGEGLWAGSQLGLVTGFQTLDNSRVTFVGGADVFSDEYAQNEISK
ncbi:hypothetical protein DXG01_015768 [Tephrocybe rancida]|nr:hypothetical protein DXG01_015768 [Tephrocybe rancida]